MKKKDLATGHVVTFRNGFKGMFYGGVNFSAVGRHIVNSTLNISLTGLDYNEDLICKSNEEYDIIKVEAMTSPFEFNKPVSDVKVRPVPLWERKPVMRIYKSAVKIAFDCEEFVIIDDGDENDDV